MARTKHDEPGDGFRPIEVDIRPDETFRPIEVGSVTAPAVDTHTKPAAGTKEV